MCVCVRVMCVCGCEGYMCVWKVCDVCDDVCVCVCV